VKIHFDQSLTQNFSEAIQREWLETNGLGGWASSTIIGAHTRRYHGLLVAALRPPVGRTVLLSKLDEAVGFDKEQIELGSNLFPGAIHPRGYQYLESFSKHLFPVFIYNFEYPVEKYRGQDFQEDLFTPGTFICRLKAGDRLGVIASTTTPANRDAFDLFETERNRRLQLIANLKVSDEITETLALAADQFIVKRGEELKTIIAGYHWFTDWGRDTMIALPGLTLSTGRFGDAKKILRAFARNTSQGMLPNRFPDYGEAPEYNTVDATLAMKVFDPTRFLRSVCLTRY
jgi:glycogen debranching enzyme